jgi:hypothetical protein
MPHDELIQALSVDDVNSRRKAENALYLQYAYMVNTVRGKYSLDEDGASGCLYRYHDGRVRAVAQRHV